MANKNVQAAVECTGQITITLMSDGKVNGNFQLLNAKDGRKMLNAARDLLEDAVIHKQSAIEVPDEQITKHFLRPPPENAN